VDPGLVAAPCGHGRQARRLLPLIGSGGAVAWFAAGDAEPRRQDRASAWEGGQDRAVRRALGALGDGVVDRCARVQGGPEWGDERLGQEGMGGEHPRSGGQWEGTRHGVEAVGDDVRRAHMVVAAAALQGGASGQWHGLPCRPWREKGAEEAGGLVVEPRQGRRNVVFAGPGEPMGAAPFGTNEAAARGYEWFEGAPGGTLGLHGVERITMCAQALTLACGVRRIVLGLAGGEGLALARSREGSHGQEDEEVVLTQGRDERPCMACTAKGHRVPCEPWAQGAHPRIARVWWVVKRTARACLRACRWPAAIGLGLGPVAAEEGGTCLRRSTRHVSPPVTEARG
jgi:hypothetical protein